MAKSSAISLRESQHKTASKGKKKKVMSIEFEPAEGGVISRTRQKDDDDEDYGPSETKVAIHPTADHAAAHLMVTMAQCFEEKGSGNKPADGRRK